MDGLVELRQYILDNLTNARIINMLFISSWIFLLTMFAVDIFVDARQMIAALSYGVGTPYVSFDDCGDLVCVSVVWTALATIFIKTCINSRNHD